MKAIEQNFPLVCIEVILKFDSGCNLKYDCQMEARASTFKWCCLLFNICTMGRRMFTRFLCTAFYIYIIDSRHCDSDISFRVFQFTNYSSSFARRSVEKGNVIIIIFVAWSKRILSRKASRSLQTTWIFFKRTTVQETASFGESCNLWRATIW